MEFTQGVRFDSLGLLPEMTRALEKKNIEWSTPVQAGCIPNSGTTDIVVSEEL